MGHVLYICSLPNAVLTHPAVIFTSWKLTARIHALSPQVVMRNGRVGLLMVSGSSMRTLPRTKPTCMTFILSQPKVDRHNWLLVPLALMDSLLGRMMDGLYFPATV